MKLISTAILSAGLVALAACGSSEEAAVDNNLTAVDVEPLPEETSLDNLAADPLANDLNAADANALGADLNTVDANLVNGQ